MVDSEVGHPDLSGDPHFVGLLGLEPTPITIGDSDRGTDNEGLWWYSIPVLLLITNRTQD